MFIIIIIIIIIITIFDPGTQFPWNKKNYAMQYKNVQKSSWNEPYSSSSFTKQPCNAVRWHYYYYYYYYYYTQQTDCST